MNTTVWRAPNGGSVNLPITLKVYPGETVIYDGVGRGGSEGNGNYWIWLSFGTTDGVANSNHKYLIVDGFILQNFKGEAIGINRSANNIIIQNTTIKDTKIALNSGHGIYIAGYATPWPTNITIRNNYFSTPKGASLHMYHGPTRSGESIYFYNNIIEGSKVGVLTADGAKDIYIYNNTFYSGSNEAISLRFKGQDATILKMLNIVIKNNIVYSTNGFGLSDSSDNSNIYTEDNNLWYAISGKPFCLNFTSGSCGGSYSLSEYKSIRGQGAYSIADDPLFNNILTGDFSLKTGSVAIDAGLSLPAVATDYTGAIRPQGNAYDIGAYEYASGGTDTTPPAAPLNVSVQ